METFRYPRLSRPSSPPPPARLSDRQNIHLPLAAELPLSVQIDSLPPCLIKDDKQILRLEHTARPGPAWPARSRPPVPSLPHEPAAPLPYAVRRRPLPGGGSSALARPPSPLPRAQPISARLPPALSQSAPASFPKRPPLHAPGSRVPARAKVAALPGRSREGEGEGGAGAGAGHGTAASGPGVALTPGVPASVEPSGEGAEGCVQCSRVDESSAQLRLLACFPLCVS